MRRLLGAFLLVASSLAVPTGAHGQQIIFTSGGTCGGGWIIPPYCTGTTPIIYPAGVVGYGLYPYGYGTISSASITSPWPGRTIRLGEDSQDFWDRHGGFDAGEDQTESLPMISVIQPVDRVSPLSPGDAEERIQHLDLEVDRIEAVGSSVTYHLSDGRIITAKEGMILEVAAN